MLNNRTETTVPSVEDLNRQADRVERDNLERQAAGRVKDGPHTVLTFPVPVQQLGPRKVAIPTVPVDYAMFTDSFEHIVREAIGVTPGDEFIEEMTQLISRRLIIAQIR